MSIRNLLYERNLTITDKISVYVPTVGEILHDENNYYSLLCSLTAMPIDYMVQLDKMGLDFAEMTEYELFLRLFPYIQSMDTSMFFGELNLRDFKYACDEDGDIVLVNPKEDIVINGRTQAMIASALRKIHGTKKDVRKPANKEARDYMLEIAKRKANRRKNRVEQSNLETVIVAMVNTEQFKYDFQTVKDLTIYQFNESLHQIVKKVDYNNRMFGVYTGNIKIKDLSKDDLNWLTH